MSALASQRGSREESPLCTFGGGPDGRVTTTSTVLAPRNSLHMPFDDVGDMQPVRGASIGDREPLSAARGLMLRRREVGDSRVPLQVKLAGLS